MDAIVSESPGNHPQIDSRYKLGLCIMLQSDLYTTPITYAYDKNINQTRNASYIYR